MILRRIAVLGLLPTIVLLAGGLADLKKGFEKPPQDARIMVRWWWFGPAVTHAELERELLAMKQGGVGGVEIQPVYPLMLDDAAKGVRNLPYLSPEFLDAVGFTARRGRELGLRVDLTVGSGWPYGGPHIPLGLAAGRVRVEKTADEVKLHEGEEVIARFPEQRLTFISSHTKQMVKRAAYGAEGYVLDHYSRAALDRHLRVVGEPQLKMFGPTPPDNVFCDSLEVYGSDWTPALLDEFQKRRGYDLKPLLPALVGDLDEKSGAIRNDWALTLTELLEDNFLKPANAWAREHKTMFRAQVYGTPPATIASQQYVDQADGEQTFWKTLSATRWAASANHLLDRPVTATETWTWLHSPSFAANPLDVKAEADRHWLQGVNHMIAHGWPYSPAAAGRPGWALYAAAVFNDSNPWYVVMPDLAAYLQRMNWLLRQGKPVSDVALYVPVGDARARFTAGTGRVALDRMLGEVMGREIIPQVLAAGYSFDAVDDGLLDKALDGRYKAVVLAHVERIPLASLQKLARFADSGGVVLAVGKRTSLATGYQGFEEQSRQVRQLAERLFDGAAAQGRSVAGDQELGASLQKLVLPDVVFSPADPEMGFAHRSVDGAEVYFVANTSNHVYKGKLRCRAASARAEWFDALTGKTRPVELPELELAPYESRVLVFSPEAAGARPGPAREARVVEVATGWRVRFESLQRAITMDTLRSWTDDVETRFYSGTATYEKEVTLDLPKGAEVELDFGAGTPTAGRDRQNGMRAFLAAPVRDAAVVYVNGKRAGAVWTTPFRLDISEFARSGTNSLRILVANTALNLLAEKGEPDYSAVTAKFGERFQMQDMRNMKPEPAGLLGGVRVVIR